MSQRPPDLRPGRGTIFRDAYGVPHLWADTVDDLAYVQGFEAGYERAWQLEYARLRAEGRTAALLGESAVEWDIFARRARLTDTARRAFGTLDGRTRAWCTSYVEGVNDALAAGAVESAEFRALDLRPGRWQSWTPLAVFAGIHILFGTCQYKLWRAHVAATMGAEFVDVFGLEGGAGEDGGIEAGSIGGSNAYAVTGDRSPTGLPIVAGDPHRTLEVPNVYQQVRLACPEFDVAGLAFPGVPGIAHFGHAGPVAWATTNAMADYQDLYVEHVRTDPATGCPEALGPQGWRPVDRRIERIEVRGGTAVDIEAIETSRGPIVIELTDGPSYSLRTPSRVELDLGFAALLPLLHARTVAEVERAMSAWVEPVNALVIADRGGRLRQRIVGLVPDRTLGNRLLPAEAGDPDAVWRGSYLHPEPRDGDVVVNANDRASGAGLGYDYAPPDRARRIRTLLEGGAAVDGGLGAVSTDTEQPALITLRALLAAVGASGPTLSEKADRLRTALLGWDGRADADSVEAGQFAAWRTALVRWLLAQPPLQPLSADSGLPALFARWVDPVIRVGSAWQDLIRSGRALAFDPFVGVAHALEVAADGPDRPWGQSHLLAPLHPLSGGPGAPELPVTPLSGDAGCVLATRSYPGWTDACNFGPVARYVWDLADRDRSRWIVPLGASARQRSPHRVDQLPLWSRGETIPLTSAWSQLRLERTLPRRPPAESPQ